jgi:hypothetical protein
MNPRRSFLETLLGGTALALLPASGLGAGSQAEPRAPSDVALLNTALELEHAAIFAYGLAAGSGLLSRPVLEVGGLFKGSHEGHREALSSAVRKLGGFPITPRPAYDFGAFELKSERDVLRLALFLELKAAHTYQKALAQFRRKSLLDAAGRILGDEASHAAVLRAALGKGPVAFFGQLDEGLE